MQVYEGNEPLLHEIFEKTAQDYPSHVAIESREEGTHWSYQQLDHSATALATLLHQFNVCPGDFIGIYLPRCAYFYLCMLAILKAGGGYVSIDPEYPIDRIQHIISDSSSRLIIIDDNEVLSMYRRGSFGLICWRDGALCLESDESLPLVLGDLPLLFPLSCVINWLDSVALNQFSNILPHDIGLSPCHPCYAIFTSGSTGKPKGVCLEHRNVVNFLLSEQIMFPTFPNDRVLQGFSTCFDASVEEIWLAFSSGATLVIGSKELMRTGPLLGKELENLGITVFSTVPTVLRVCEDIPPPPLLRVVITGGEACPSEVVSKWSAEGRTFLNTYGPTEATVIATMAPLHPEQRKVTIGKAIQGYSCHIVDQEGNPCPPYSPGELLLGGYSIARGYINRPDLNPEKFIDDPNPPVLPNWVLFNWRDYVGAKKQDRGPLEGEEAEKAREIFLEKTKDYIPRLYRSGDLCQFDQEGNIEFLGRIDSQVKIRGFRVELNEIETVLCTHPYVEQCCVVARTDIEGQNGEMSLVAYVSCRKRGYYTGDDLDTLDSNQSPLLAQRVEKYLAREMDGEVGGGTDAIERKILLRQPMAQLTPRPHAYSDFHSNPDSEGLRLRSPNTLLPNSAPIGFSQLPAIVSSPPRVSHLPPQKAESISHRSDGVMAFSDPNANNSISVRTQPAVFLSNEAHSSLVPPKSPDELRSRKGGYGADVSAKSLLSSPSLVAESFLPSKISSPLMENALSRLGGIRVMETMTEMGDRLVDQIRRKGKKKEKDSDDEAMDCQSRALSDSPLLGSEVDAERERASKGENGRRGERRERGVMGDVSEERRENFLEATEISIGEARDVSFNDKGGSFPEEAKRGERGECVIFKRLVQSPSVSTSPVVPYSPLISPIVLDISKESPLPSSDQYVLNKLLTPAALRSHCIQTLPGYMVPSRYVVLDKIPQMPSGKIDRKAIENLPPPDASTLPCMNEGNTEEDDELETPIEKFIADIWKTLLGCSRVKASDDFFDLGGSSLTAAQFISILRKKIPCCPLAVKDVYQTQILRALSERLETILLELEMDVTLLIAPPSPERDDATTIGMNSSIQDSSLWSDRTKQGEKSMKDAWWRREGEEAAPLGNSGKSIVNLYGQKKRFFAAPIVARFRSFFSSASTVSTYDRSHDSSTLSPLSANHHTSTRESYRSFTRLIVQLLQIIVLLINVTYSVLWTAFYVVLLFHLKDQLKLNNVLVVLLFPCVYFTHFWLNIFLSLAIKWILLGRVKEGTVPLWSFSYLRWWIVKSWVQSIDLSYLSGTFLLPIIMRLFGAKIGKNVHISSKYVGLMNYDLLHIGDNCVINTGVYIRAIEVDDGYVEKRRVVLEADVLLGNTCFVSRGCRIGAYSELTNGTNLSPNTNVPPCQVWHDSPGCLHSYIEPSSIGRTTCSTRKSVLFHIAFFFLWTFSLLAVDLIHYAPRALLVLFLFLSLSLSRLVILAIALSFWTYLIGPSLFLCLMKKCLFPRGISAGSYSLTSIWYCRYWAFRYILHKHLLTCHPFYSTMFTSKFLTFLGAKIAPGVEVSDALDFTPDLLHISKNCFVADAVNLGPWSVSRYHRLHLEVVQLGEETFIGNNSLVPLSTNLPKGNLLGVMSVAPPSTVTAQRTDASYLGVNAFILPNRTVVQVDSAKTIHPPLKMKILRAVVEGYRTIAPGLLLELAFVFCWWIYKVFFILAVENEPGTVFWNIGPINHTLLTPLLEGEIYSFHAIFPAIVWLVAVLPLLGVIYTASIGLAVLCQKWLFIGKHKEGNYPLWSLDVWRTELVTTLSDDAAYKIFGRAFAGTFLLPLWFRLLGCRIGSRVYIDTPYFLEHDLISIGDDVCISENCTVQTHLFEDRVMKLGSICIGDKCTVGARSVVLYSTTMQRGSSLTGMSLMMKGETFGKKQTFTGVPAVPLHHNKRK